jgi:hypothetical protein
MKQKQSELYSLFLLNFLFEIYSIEEICLIPQHTEVYEWIENDYKGMVYLRLVQLRAVRKESCCEELN